MQVQMGVEMMGGAVCFICAVIAWAAMGRQTRHCFRFVYGVVGVAGLALVLDPLFAAGLAPYARSAIILGFSMHLVLDRRRIRPDRKAAKTGMASMRQDPEATTPLGSVR